MGWWKRRKKRLAEEKWIERMRTMGWEKPTVKWSVPDILQFSLLAQDKSGEVVEEWYLGTRGWQEPEALFMLVAYGLTEVPERIVAREEAMQIWSKWLSVPLVSPIPFLSQEGQASLYKDWIDWAKDVVENWEVAEKQIAAVPSSCTFRVSVV